MTTPRPRLSWWSPAGLAAPEAHEIEATVGGELLAPVRVEGPDSVLCPWPFRALQSREGVDWRVRTRTDSTWSPWSAPSRFTVGLLQPDDWVGSFVGDPDDGADAGARGQRPAVYLRRRFRIDEPVTRAVVHATALGIYELHLDGERVGDLELTPGFTAYRHHLEVQTYELAAEALAVGDHELVATLSDGWYRGSLGFTRVDRCFGDRLALLAQVELEMPTGARHLIATDERWESSTQGPIRAADLIEGQMTDLRVAFPPHTGWRPAVAVPSPDGVALESSPAPPTRVTETFPARSVRQVGPHRQVIDIGEDINGWLEIDSALFGQPGDEIRLTYGEVLADDGSVDMTNLEVHDFMTKESLGHGQVDTVTVGPDGGCFEPRHTTHGFQFVQIDGAEPLQAADVNGRMVHTDLVRTGWFVCSDDRINRLHDAVVLSFRGNACEVPTDCPHRERAGWTGDWQIFAPTAAYLYDVGGFSERWLRDLAADQWPDGRVTNHVPDPVGPPGWSHPMSQFITGSAGWGDAAVIVPWEMWLAYGDLELLRRQYDSMVAWVEFGLSRAASLRHPTRSAVRPTPASHEEYLWDGGFHWGEWSEPGASADPVFAGELDQGHVATAYLSRSLAIVSNTAALLDQDRDADRFAELSRRTRSAWRAEYFDGEGVAPRTQATLARALHFGLLENDEEPAVADELVRLIREADTHLSTGFLTTPFLLPVLAEHGHLDVAYDLLLQDTPPSWLYMVEQGSTTVWENWDGVGADGVGSLNHYSKGAVATFLHRYVAGIQPLPATPGYRRFLVRPRIGGGLTSVDAHLDSPRGRISVRWRLDGDELTVDLDVPSGSNADVVLPDGRSVECGPGPHSFLVRVDPECR